MTAYITSLELKWVIVAFLLVFAGPWTQYIQPRRDFYSERLAIMFVGMALNAATGVTTALIAWVEDRRQAKIDVAAATWATLKPSCCKWMLRSAFWWQHTWTGVKNNILRTICFSPESFHARSAHSLESSAPPLPHNSRTSALVHERLGPTPSPHPRANQHIPEPP